jgi:signal transduction histidine kinase
MYKKNAELAATNKTLSILRKVDEIIMGSVTDLVEIANQVTTLAVNESVFKLIYIFSLNRRENALTRLAFGADGVISENSEVIKRFNFLETISLLNKDNIAVQVLHTQKITMTSDMYEILRHNDIMTMQEAQEVQRVAGIKTAMAYPFIVRNEVIGVMLACLDEEYAKMPPARIDLIERFVNVIGIALDNALLYNEVKETNKKLRALDRLKDEFVSLASHELRTPMTAIKSYLWLFLEDSKNTLTEKQRRYLERAYSSTDRLINLVNDMLNVSRIESGRMVLDPQLSDLTKIIQDVISEIMPAAQKQEVELSFQVGQQQMPQVFVDINKIKQVLINLIGNSVKFTPSGGKIVVTVSIQDNMVLASVTDTGKGISKEDLPKLFQKFGIIESNYLVKQNIQGTGLGLYISKSIVELHGGKMWVQSEGKDRGATFTFGLPIPKIMAGYAK